MDDLANYFGNERMALTKEEMKKINGGTHLVGCTIYCCWGPFQVASTNVFTCDQGDAQLICDSLAWESTACSCDCTYAPGPGE